MTCEAVIDSFREYRSNKCPAELRKKIELHLQGCTNCQSEYQEFLELSQQIGGLPEEIYPSTDLWPTISRRITEDNPIDDSGPRTAVGETDPAGITETSPNTKRNRLIIWGLSTAAVLVVVFLGSFLMFGPPLGESWNVAALEGTPRVGASSIENDGSLAVGEWLETDHKSKVRLEVARIGEILVEPNSLLRLVTSKWLEHRIALDRGTIQARIWAPPRLFFVDTPSATAVDLGCAYTLKVELDGTSWLNVTSGRVGLQLNGREAFVPAGASCITKPGKGPGTPYFEDATESFKQALKTLDFGQAGMKIEALNTVLAEARIFDALTLWHLMFQTNKNQRQAIFSTLTRLVPETAEVSGDAVVNLDEDALKQLKNRLEIHWSREDVPFWKEIWREIFQ